jgi:hypothetical protein
MEQLPGFRNALMVLREVAEIAEKHPEIPQPDITFTPKKESGAVVALTGKVRFHVWGDASFGYGEHGATYAERKRLSIENGINAIVDAYGPELGWVANDPSGGGYDQSYFQLTAQWHGMAIEVVTMRSDVGEEVTVIESGPQVITDGDTVQLVRQSATVWKPNISIGRRATPAYELEAKPLVLAVEA